MYSKSRQAAELIEYVRKKYSCEPDFSGTGFPTMPFGAEDSGKWFDVFAHGRKEQANSDLNRRT